MPSLIIQNEKIIALEVWPYSMDMLHDCEYSFNSNFASHWYYHMYDNNIVLFMHMRESDNEGGEEQMNFPGASNQNVRVDITVSPITFKSFFIHMEDNVSNTLATDLENIEMIVQDREVRDKEFQKAKKLRMKNKEEPTDQEIEDEL